MPSQPNPYFWNSTKGRVALARHAVAARKLQQQQAEINKQLQRQAAAARKLNVALGHSGPTGHKGAMGPVGATGPSQWYTLVQHYGYNNTTNLPVYGSPQETPMTLDLHFQTEPVRAFRAWKLETFITREYAIEYRLGGVGTNGLWPTYRRMEATCVHHHHEAPFPNCTCGVWAMKEERYLTAVRSEYCVKVYGSVNLWGRVLVCNIGYRAQYAYPESLYCTDQSLVQPLADLYGVPVAYAPDVSAIGGIDLSAPSGNGGGIYFHPTLQTSSSPPNMAGWTTFPAMWSSSSGTIQGSGNLSINTGMSPDVGEADGE